MNKHLSVRCCGERDDAKGALQEHTFRHRLLLACLAVALTVGGPAVGWAVSGEPVGGEGLHRTGDCTTDFRISCDDRSEGGVVSCHMRRPSNQDPAIDEGLAIDACIDGRVTTDEAPSLETDIDAIIATDFGEFVCGKEPDGSDFCLVCDTFTVPGDGASLCVKIVNDQELPEPSTCGAFNISADPGGFCPSAELDLQQSFSDPHVGFTIGINGSDAGDPGQKDLLVCGSRSWQCTNRSSEFPLPADQVLQQQTHALVDTPCCIRLSSGGYYCSSKLTTSSTCK